MPMYEPKLESEFEIDRSEDNRGRLTGMHSGSGTRCRWTGRHLTGSGVLELVGFEAMILPRYKPGCLL